MQIIKPGHEYELEYIDDDEGQLASSRERLIMFVNRESEPRAGTTVQEVCRVLISRVQYCNMCLPWEGNDDIIEHLRMAIALHEARAMVRKVEKGLIEPEHVRTDVDGHFRLEGGLISVGRDGYIDDGT